MDKFLIPRSLKATTGKNQREPPGTQDAALADKDLGPTRKRTSRSASPPDGAASSTGAPWKQIRAEGLSCDYRILFSKAEADGIFHELEKQVEYSEGHLTKLHIFGKWHKIPRKQATYGDAGLTYRYSGVTFSPKPWIPVLDRIRDRVQLATGHAFNFVLINRYKDGRDHMGEHRDDEAELVPGSPIASVSFGAGRDFVFRHSASRGTRAPHRLEPIRLQLEHGSLLVMNPPTNRCWHHSLPIRRRVLAPRINLTFRKVRALLRGPPLHSVHPPPAVTSD